MTTSIYGTILTAQDVTKAAEDTLKAWSPAYLAEVGVQHGLARGDLPEIRSWEAWPVFEQWPENQLPAIVVVTPGTNAVPEMLNKQATVAWSIGVAIVVSARDEEATADLIGYYSAAVRALMIQKGSLGGFAVETSWVSERFDDIPILEQARTLRTAMVMFSTIVEGMVQRYGGPAEPPDDPTADPGSSPIITSVTETVTEVEHV